MANIKMKVKYSDEYVKQTPISKNNNQGKIDQIVQHEKPFRKATPYFFYKQFYIQQKQRNNKEENQTRNIGSCTN
jgi:hypothetical protein